MSDATSLSLNELQKMSKEELLKLVLDHRAKANDSEIQSELLYDLVKRYVELNQKLKLTIKEVERLSNTDSLTGLYNRLYFNKSFEQELSRYKRYKQPFSIALIDIDHFKSVNDHYGHNVGDLVLKEISRIFVKSLRKEDICARWGGEEFIILLTGDTLEGSVAQAERIRKRVEGVAFEDLGHVTISIGVAEVAWSDTLTSLTAIADKALYEAKRSGRNKVVKAQRSVDDRSVDV